MLSHYKGKDDFQKNRRNSRLVRINPQASRLRPRARKGYSFAKYNKEGGMGEGSTAPGVVR